MLIYENKKFKWAKSAEIIKDIIRKYELTNSDNMAMYEIWVKVVGNLAKKIQLLGKKGKVLLVKTDNQTYRQELTLRKKEIVTKINHHFGKQFISDIKIQQG